MVPRIRSSSYLELLVSKLPSLRYDEPGKIRAEALPSLRNLAVVDNEEHHKEELKKLDLKATIDWREIFQWTRRVGLERKQSVKNDDIVTIQFTSGTTGLPKAVSVRYIYTPYHDPSHLQTADAPKSYQQRAFHRTLHEPHRKGCHL